MTNIMSFPTVDRWVRCAGFLCLRPSPEPFRRDRTAIKETENNRMAETKVVTEVAGRVCALVANVGDQIGEGDDIILVEAMKMELPVSAPGGGTVKTILVKIDDVVAEGQVVATIG
jgi:biotin carboxyl carrier protein